MGVIMKRQAGMTLIELVIVIIVLGIIAAVAAPRFVDISGSALTSAEAGSVGAFKSALVITIAEQQTAVPFWSEIEANLDGFDTTTTVGEVSVDLDSDGTDDVTINGYTDACTTAVTTEATDVLVGWSSDGGVTCNLF